jgi:hypothetical protein
MLSDNYLDDLEPVPENEYANFNTYDTTEPLLTELYESMFDTPSSAHVKCTTEKLFLTQEYKKYFSAKQTQQLETLKFNSNSPKCSFEIILFILKLEAKRRDYKRLETITINHLKIVIAQFYIDAIDKQYTEGIKERFAKLLKYYGMESISDEYRIKFVSNEDDNFIETLPFFESYHLTRLDIWILSTYYKIPIIILYYPNKALIETNDEYSILTTYYEESLLSTRSRAKSVERKESEESEEDFPEFGEAARPAEEQKNPNEQGYYFIIAPAIKTNIAPSYSIIFRKVTGSELESGVSAGASVGNVSQYYIPLNILTYTSQSSIIDQQSKQYINIEDPPQSEDDESAQMKESLRYKNSITQFIQKFKPPSKKGKSDDSSSIGTGASLDIQEEEILDASTMKKQRKSSKPRQRINISSQVFESLAQPASEAVSVAPPKAKKREKGAGIRIKPFPSQLLSVSEDPESQEAPIGVEEKGKSKPKLNPKKQSINVSSIQLPTFGAKAAPNPADLSDIAEAEAEESSKISDSP